MASTSRAGSTVEPSEACGSAGGFLLDLAIEDIEAGDVPAEEARVLTGVLAPDLHVLEVGTLMTSLRGFEDSIGRVQAGFGIDFPAILEPGYAPLVALSRWTGRDPSRRASSSSSEGPRAARRCRAPRHGPRVRPSRARHACFRCSE